MKLWHRIHTRQINKFTVSERTRDKFMSSCRNGNLKRVQHLYQKHQFDNDTCIKAFKSACFRNQLSIAKYMIGLIDADTLVEKNNIFFMACVNGWLDLAQWLVEIWPDMDVDDRDGAALRYAQIFHRQNVVDWLYSIKLK